MEVEKILGGSCFLIKESEGETTHFRFQIGDLSSLYGPEAWCKACHKNDRKIKKLLGENELNEFRLTVMSGDIRVYEPVLTRERTAEDIKKGCSGLENGCEIKSEVARIDVEITLPIGGAVSIMSLKDSFEVFIYNDNGEMKLTSDYHKIAEETCIYF